MTDYEELVRVRTLLVNIQNALVEAFYDPDPADPTPELDYSQVDWIGVIRDARETLDRYKGKV